MTDIYDGASNSGLYVDLDATNSASSSSTPTISTQSIGISTQSLVSIQSTLVGRLMRWPSGGRPQTAMTNAQAYFRDAYVGIEYTASGGGVNKEWTVQYENPETDGSSTRVTTNFLPLYFYPDLGGTPNCFYSPGWAYYICGSASISVTAWHKSQCDPAGSWSFRIFEDGIRASQDYNFTLNLEIPPDEMQAALNQYSGSPHPYDSLCYIDGDEKDQYECLPTDPLSPFFTRFTIGEKGCAMTAAAMVGEYHNASIGDGQGLKDLNDWLVNNSGFVHDSYNSNYGLIVWNKIASYSNLQGGNVSWIKKGNRNDTELRKMICTYGPQVIAVNRGGHFVTAIGRDGNTATSPWKIYDPAGGIANTNLISARGGRYGGTYSSARYYKGASATYPFPIYGFKVELYSPAEVLVTAPDGSKSGYDPIADKFYDEIPEASYTQEGYDNAETGFINPHKMKSLEISGAPQPGDYKIQVTGTGDGTYTMVVESIGVSDSQKKTSVLKDVPVQAGITHQYNISYSSPTSEIETSGGYDGGGQRPKDVNKFLSYSSPGQARTNLPLGTTSYRVAVSYGKTTDVTTFSAVLNGADITSMFKPIAGTSESVIIPVAQGSNVLKLSIKGATDTGRVATDSDRLVLLVD